MRDAIAARFAVLALVTGMTLVTGIPANASEFDISTVTSAAIGQTSLVIDSTGDANIAFFESAGINTYRLRFAHGRPGAWTVETVDTDVGLSASLAVASNGTPYISYFYSAASDLRLATKSGTTWGHVTVDATGTVGQWSSLALNHLGRPVMSYYGQGHLKFAVFNGTSFTITTVDATNSTVGQYTSLRLYGTSDIPHISYYDAANGDLKYATNPSGSWLLTPVDSVGDVGSWTSITLVGHAGSPAVSYYDVTNTALKFAASSGLSYQLQTLDEVGDVGRETSCRGYAVAYTDQTNGTVKYAERNAIWDLHVVDGGNARYPSLAFDSSGAPCISYISATAGELRFAVGARLWSDLTTYTGSYSGPTQGVAWGDYDNDGWPDLFLSNNGAASVLLHSSYGSFTNVAVSPVNYANCVAAQWADYDNDGDLDLFTAGGGMSNKLFRNLGAAGGYAFQELLGRPVSDTTAEGVWLDADGDGNVDLLLASYLYPNQLLHNSGEGGGYAFTNTASGELLGVGATAFASVAWWASAADFIDIAVITPQPNLGLRLLHNTGTTFGAGPALAPGGYINGLAWGDYNNDSRPDLLVIRGMNGDPLSTALLYRSDGTFGPFSAQSVPALAIPSRSAAWGDVDNDGDLDVYVTGLGVPDRLLRNDSSGTTTAFTDITPPLLAVSGTGRAAAFADCDLDGDLDLFLANDGSTSRLFRNDLENGNHWLKIELRGPGGSRNVTGARISLTAGGVMQWREITAGSGGRSQNMPIAFFGLGSATTVDQLTIRWPRYRSEAPQTLTNLAVDRVIEVTEPWPFTQISLGSLTDADFRGLAWGDYDRDGDPDLAASSAGYLASGPLGIYRNDSGVFVVADSPADLMGGGLAWGDYDNDGWLDLIVQEQYGIQWLFHNNHGYLNSANTPIRPPLATLSTWTGVAWLDCDRDGFLDIYAVNSEASFYPTSPNYLYRNDRHSWFTESTPAGLGVTGLSENAVCADYDNDGDPDILLLRTGSPTYPGLSLLLRNDGVAGFTSVAAGSFGGIAAVAGAWGDYDNDGDLDVIVGHSLLRNDGGDVFTPVALPTVYGATSVSWVDYDLDGDLDLARGGTTLRNDGGGAFVAEHNFLSGGGAAPWADYDRDGDPDLVLSYNGNLTLCRNDQRSGNHWLQVDLRGTVSNAAAIGARARVVAGGVSQIREVSGGSGWWSEDDLVLSFGLGASTSAETLQVRWPSGYVQTFTQGVLADRRHTIQERNGGATDAPPVLPAVLVFAAPRPNPANPGTVLRFELPRAATVRLTIYDVAGRRVAEPVRGERRDAGVHEIFWDGRNDRRVSVASGVYLARLVTDIGTRVQRFSIVR